MSQASTNVVFACVQIRWAFTEILLICLCFLVARCLYCNDCFTLHIHCPNNTQPKSELTSSLPTSVVTPHQKEFQQVGLTFMWHSWWCATKHICIYAAKNMHANVHTVKRRYIYGAHILLQGLIYSHIVCICRLQCTFTQACIAWPHRTLIYVLG